MRHRCPLLSRCRALARGGACAVRNPDSSKSLLGTLLVTWTSWCFFLVPQVIVHSNNTDTKVCGGADAVLQISRCC